jgi:PAS domain S-box-containing protein
MRLSLPGAHRIRSPIDVGFWIGVSALVLVGLLSLRTAINQRTESRWVEHTYDVLRELDRTRAEVEQARLRQSIGADLSKSLSRLDALTDDNPVERARLDTLRNLLPAQPDAALATIATMQSVESGFLAVRSRRTDEATRRSIEIIVTSTVLAVILMGIALRLLHDDLARRRDAEAALVESEANHRLLMQRAADAILMVDADAVCVDANDRAAEIIGRAREEILGLPLRGFVRSDRSDDAAVLPMLRFGHVTTGEFWVVQPTGARVPVEISATILEDGRVQIIARDISERKEIERMKDEFVSVVSHELRTPLTALRGSLGLLASGRFDEVPDKRARMLELATGNTDRLIRLVNDILDVERIDSGGISFERVESSVRPLIQHAVEVIRPVAERAGVEIHWEAPELRIWADPDRMTQTLTNLIDNAVKFSPAGSVVGITARRDNRMAQFEIHDQGRGIPKDKRDLVFKRFQQVDTSDAREKGGTGLGLAIARSIVEQHDGKIWIAENVEIGSTFCFTIPLFVDPTQLAS